MYLFGLQRLGDIIDDIDDINYMQWSLNAPCKLWYSIAYLGCEGLDKPVCRMSDSNRGGQPKLSRSGLSWLRPKVIESKNGTGKLLRLHKFPAIEIIVHM